jgi:peptide deformylase
MTMKIAQLGQPVLRQVAQPIPAEEIQSPAFQAFLQEMRTTLEREKGAGLAGPQVFASRRVFLAMVLPPAGENGPRQIETFINPKLLGASVETSWAWEGCLSFPELLVLVERHRAVRIEYLNTQGEPRTLDLTGFPARVVQHEYDHLDGVLTLDRAPSTRYIIKASELDAVLDAEAEERASEGEEKGDQSGTP